MVACSSGYTGSSTDALITCNSSTAIEHVLLDDGGGFQKIYAYTKLSIGDTVRVNSGAYTGCIIGIY